MRRRRRPYSASKPLRNFANWLRNCATSSCAPAAQVASQLFQLTGLNLRPSRLLQNESLHGKGSIVEDTESDGFGLRRLPAALPRRELARGPTGLRPNSDPQVGRSERLLDKLRALGKVEPRSPAGWIFQLSDIGPANPTRLFSSPFLGAVPIWA